MIQRLKKCALCENERELELSHIVPKMAVRALKRTSVGGIRNTDNPDLIVQDSEKHYMLCSDCEDLFSPYETYFSNTIFQPFLNNKKVHFDYDSKLFYFITSVSWRSLYLDLLDFVENHVVGIDALECLIDAEKTMRDYLLNRRSDIGKIENHIFFFDGIKEIVGSVDGVDLRKMHPNAAFHRGITSYTFCNEENNTYGTITNMMGVMLLTLYKLGSEEKWVNTKIINGTGFIEARDQQVTSVVGNEFTNIMVNLEKSIGLMSQKQKDKVIEHIKNSRIPIEKTAIYEDWINDKKLSNNVEE